MKIIIVDDEPMSIEVFKYEVRKFTNVKVVGEFTCGTDALEYVKSHPVDVAVLDIQMWGMDGLQLGKQLKKQCPSILLVYISAYADYASKAVKLQPEAYLMKPLSSGELAFVMEASYEKIQKRNKRIFARTFGYFDLYVDGKPIMFRSAKAKELLALLIDREGGTVTTEQIICTLWEDRPNDEATQSLCCKVGKTLEKELRAHHAEDLVVSARGMKRLNTDVLECDLYQLLKRDTTAINQFLGEYMLEYSWAEPRMALLERYL